MILSIELEQQLADIRERAALLSHDLETLESLKKKQEENLQYAAGVLNDKLGSVIESDKFLSFFKRPYVTIPTGKNRVLVAVPKFIPNFTVGWFWKETESFYIYQLDQYSVWLGDVPQELMAEINFKPAFQATVDGDKVVFSPESKDTVKKTLGPLITDVAENQARIVRGHQFDVLAEIISAGSLPFKPRPVDKADLRPAQSAIKLRPYQQVAEDRFLDTGAIGVFHPTGAGKSFIVMHVSDILKGPKLIVVPTRTLADQWAYYVETHIPHAKNEIKIVTYQGFRVDDTEYVLTVYDECQRLPADTFSRLATINTKYRLGLSASPYREDGRTDYIFALTGFPMGLDWKTYMTTVGRSYHPINVYVVRSTAGKLSKMASLIDMTKKTLVFCDTIELGKRAAAMLKVPYIYGQTNARLDILAQNRVTVVSRVMDLGVSIKDLQRIIEIDFLFGSRQQEIQRTGRLMHSELTDVRHDILMTQSELDQYGKRLWALQEKGFTIRIRSDV